MRNAHFNFPELKVTSPNCLFCLTISTKMKVIQLQSYKTEKNNKYSHWRGRSQRIACIFA